MLDQMSAVLKVKSVLVGDEGVGKTSLIFASAREALPDYVPSMAINGYHHIDCDLVVDGRWVEFKPWDIPGEEDDKIRSLSYTNTDVFIICFSLVSLQSYSRVKDKWHPEVTHHCPNTPVVLVGTKLDLREDAEAIQRLRETNQSVISTAEGVELQGTIGAVKYVECSALTRQGLEAVYAEAARAALQTRAQERCTML